MTSGTPTNMEDTTGNIWENICVCMHHTHTEDCVGNATDVNTCADGVPWSTALVLGVFLLLCQRRETGGVE